MTMMMVILAVEHSLLFETRSNFALLLLMPCFFIGTCSFQSIWTFCCCVFYTLLLHKLASYLSLCAFFFGSEHHTHNLRPHFQVPSLCLFLFRQHKNYENIKRMCSILIHESIINAEYAHAPIDLPRKQNSSMKKHFLYIFIDILFRCSLVDRMTLFIFIQYGHFSALTFSTFSLHTPHTKCRADFFL